MFISLDNFISSCHLLVLLFCIHVIVQIDIYLNFNLADNLQSNDTYNVRSFKAATDEQVTRIYHFNKVSDDINTTEFLTIVRDAEQQIKLQILMQFDVNIGMWAFHVSANIYGL